MSKITECPVCEKEFDQKRIISNTAICPCGWSGLVEKQSEFKSSGMRNVCISLGLFSFLLLSVMIHTTQWNNYSLEIIPLKAKMWTGLASEQDLSRVVKICGERERKSCVEGAYEDLVELRPEHTPYLTQLALAQKASENYVDAAASFRTYFVNGGNDPEMAYQYAQVLAALGAVSDAEGYFEYVLKSKPKSFQANVMRSYVDMLMGHDELRKARKLIYEFRQKSRKAAFFLEKQLQEINKRLNVAQL